MSGLGSDNLSEPLTKTPNRGGDGDFEGLAAGVYELRCDVPGFDRVVQYVRFSAGRPQELRVRLTIASIKKELTVGENEAGVEAQVGRNTDAISVERTMLDNRCP